MELLVLQRKAALIVKLDKRTGKKTPEHIVRVAEGRATSEEALGVDPCALKKQSRQMAAALIVKLDKRTGKKTPEHIVRVAEGKAD